MKEPKKVNCIYCPGEATLVKGSIVIKKGIVKTKSPSNHYQCTTCKRTFRTKEQEANTSELQHKNKILTPVSRPRTFFLESPNHEIEDESTFQKPTES